MLTDGDQRVIPSVLRALVKVKLPKVEALLMERITHEDPTIRATAISLLGDIKHAPAAAGAAGGVGRGAEGHLIAGARGHRRQR